MSHCRISAGMGKHASYGESFLFQGKGALEDGVITVKLSHDVPNVWWFW